MGNKQVKLGLRLDDKIFTAGSLVTGRVYLSVTQEEQADGLHLLLQGEELSTIAHDEQDLHTHSGHRDHSSTHREIDRASCSLVHMDVILTIFPSSLISPGQYEFPFEWEIPSNLPGTMYCAKGDSHCEIRYRMTAYLQRSGSLFGQPKHAATQVMCVVAQPTPITHPTGIFMDPEVIPIKSCCFDSGQVALGWDVDRTVASPDSVMKISIYGANESNVEIDCLKARLIETISWSAHGRTKEEKKTLTESKISTVNLPQWHSFMRDGHHHCQPVGIADYRRSVVETQLLLPNQARDTYQGSLVQVRHSLVITAVTPPCHTTVESCSLIRVQRKSTSEIVAEANVDATYASTEEPTFVEADILPEDWRPQEAHVVSLPVSSAVLVDTEYVPPPVSAPDEALLRDHSSHHSNMSAPDESLLRGSQNHMTTALSDLLDSLACSDNPVSAVSHHLNNPMMAATIQNLTPRDFVRVLQAANRDMPKVARYLAGAMNENFQCRHVLACIWTLPPHVRMDVMKEVAPLASDLGTHRVMLERELDDQELLYFRAALK